MSGPAAHPEVTWPLSTPSSSASLAALARPSSSVVDNGQVTSDLAALGSALLPPQQLCSSGSPGR
ncbi:hypothetical protein TYRP_016931 [Tyrophagus putrescentiae]|nr:hypothetical protein TYRP_016931 [Tyrophagus putrescentiae]